MGEELPTLILKEKWSEVIKRILSHPKEVQYWDVEDYLPIHRACGHANVPVKVIEALIEAYPQCVMDQTREMDLPLHIVSGQSSLTKHDVVKLLLSYYKLGVLIRNVRGKTSLINYLFCTQPLSLETIKLYAEAHPDVVRISDKLNWFPLHYAVVRNDWNLSEYFITLYPKALWMKNKSGRTPRDLAEAFGKNEFGNKLLKEEEKICKRNINSTVNTS